MSGLEGTEVALLLGVIVAPLLVAAVIAMVLRYEVRMKITKAQKGSNPHWADLRQEDEERG